VSTPNSFGIPFDKGTVKTTDKFNIVAKTGETLPYTFTPLAYWGDGSVKWGGFAVVVPAESSGITVTPLVPSKKKSKSTPVATKFVSDTGKQYVVNTGKIKAYIPKQGKNLMDSLLWNGVKSADATSLVAYETHTTPETSDGITRSVRERYESNISNVTVEHASDIKTVVKIEGKHKSPSREWLPFVVRLYFYNGSEQVRMVHSFIYDGDQNTDMISGLGVEVEVPLRDQVYNRHVAFSNIDGGVWSEPVQPLVGRRIIKEKGNDTLNVQQLQMTGARLPDPEAYTELGQSLLKNWASWDGYRLSQLNADGYAIRKRATGHSPWIGTISGDRASGVGFIGDSHGGMVVGLHDFWQSYPSTLEIDGARSNEAKFTAWLWSTEAEPMDLRHYDDVAHDLIASYEDVQDGMSTPYGIARTTTLTLSPYKYTGKANFARETAGLTEEPQLVCTPQYFHDRHAFGIWSLPDTTNAFSRQIEGRLNDILNLYKHSIEEHNWYGFWNYGDFMHTYDPVRHEWRYDVGGYAWDNTELASNMWLWYSFLRTGRADIWNMARAMSRHTTEVDVYHIGDFAGLGSRHNVSHWGCGSKEARISQAEWNRFLYYLTWDERSGDLMTEVKDADQKLYTIDPMRLAQPRSKYPSSAPARLRIGPDWVAYAGNWMTQWERTGDTKYRDKIVAGMKSIAAMPDKIFTGPTVLGFDPAIGVLTYEGDPALKNNNHLLSLMGGFEVMNELNEMLPIPEWIQAWNEYTANYHRMGREVTHTTFPIARLAAHGAAWTGDENLKKEAWGYILNEKGTSELPSSSIRVVNRPDVLEPQLEMPTITTNGAATWSLDAIYMLEVIPQK
jgi:hypothetical protein